MRRTSVVLLLAAATVAPGCSITDSLVERVSPEEPPATSTVTIGVLAPLSGGQTRAGRSVVDAVEQAVDDAPGVDGWQVEVIAYDLAAQSREEHVAELKADDTTVAVVTGFGPDDVRTIVPELDESGLTVLSPADTDPRHVRGADPVSPLRPWSGYLTVAVEPTPKQTALADHLVRVVGAQKALVVSDGSSASAGRAAALSGALAERGVSEAETVTFGDEDGAASVQEAISSLDSGDALVFDVPADVAADLAGARRDGVALALMSPLEGLTPEQATALSGSLAPLPGQDPRQGASELADAFEASGRAGTVGPWGPAAYDGTRLLVDTFTRCLPARSSSPSRSACRAEVAGTSWSGITGPIQFDEYGARLGLLPGVVVLRDGSWGQPGE